MAILHNNLTQTLQSNRINGQNEKRSPTVTLVVALCDIRHSFSAILSFSSPLASAATGGDPFLCSPKTFSSATNTLCPLRTKVMTRKPLVHVPFACNASFRRFTHTTNLWDFWVEIGGGVGVRVLHLSPGSNQHKAFYHDLQGVWLLALYLALFIASMT